MQKPADPTPQRGVLQDEEACARRCIQDLQAAVLELLLHGFCERGLRQEPLPTGISPVGYVSKWCQGSSPFMPPPPPRGRDMVIAAWLRQPHHVQAHNKRPENHTKKVSNMV